jgi:hypothetical protein
MVQLHFSGAGIRVETGRLRLPQARAGGCDSPEFVVSSNSEPGEPRFKAADFISYPLSIPLPCGAFPGKMGTAQSRLKIPVLLSRADVEDR